MMEKSWVGKIISEMNSCRFLVLLISAFIIGGCLLFNSIGYADDKPNSPSDVKLDQQQDVNDGQSKEKVNKEKNSSEKGVRESASSENVVKSQPQKKKVPAFWVLFPE